MARPMENTSKRKEPCTTVAEAVVIFSGAWQYTQPQLVSIPLWLPFLWGLAGITIVTSYEGLSGVASIK